MTENIITKPVPIDLIKKVSIVENGEELEEISENNRINLLSEHKFLDPRLRKSVVEKLINAASNLPDGYKLLIVTAYRPISMQKKLWRQRLIQMAKKHPFKFIFKHREFKNLASQYTSPPGGSGHQSGAATDVTVINEKGERLDMGTSLTAFGELCNTWDLNISETQKKNRKILYDAMTNAGFVNYPREWWHYSYGDRM